MTAHKHLKQLIRARMVKTGERYAAARRFIIGDADPNQTDPATRWHFAGNVAGATTLRILLSHAGVRAPHTGEPFTEAMLFGIAGGIGIGLFSFYYQKEDMATFYLAGRHCWHDDQEYLDHAARAFGIQPAILETSGAKTSAQHLEKALAEHGRAIAWVDMASLPHRAMPGTFAGMVYHIVTVYSVDAGAGTAMIGDMGNVPVSISLDELTAARVRIKKQKCRLMTFPRTAQTPGLAGLVSGGLMRCVEGLLEPSLPQAKGNARLEVLRTWAERLGASSGQDSWADTFRGPNLWRGLGWIQEWIELAGTGGGLCRPLFAEFLKESAAALSRPDLESLAERYQELGRQWSALADAALPDTVPLLRGAKALLVRRAELAHNGENPEEVRKMWKEWGELQREKFPLSDEALASLRGELRDRVLALYKDEAAALEAMQEVVAVT